MSKVMMFPTDSMQASCPPRASYDPSVKRGEGRNPSGTTGETKQAIVSLRKTTDQSKLHLSLPNDFINTVSE